MTAQHIWLAFFWIIFGGVHSIFAADGPKKRIQAWMKGLARYYRLMYSVVAAAMTAWILYYNFTIPSIFLWVPSMLEKAFSLIAGIAGLSVMSVCIRRYFFDLSGISVFFTRRNDDGLVVSGLNRYVRHPLYAGTLLFTWSFFFFQPRLSNLISAVCITIYTLIGTYFEEKKLLEQFGETYRRYAQKVPMIIPKM